MSLKIIFHISYFMTQIDWATISEMWRIRHFYANYAEKDTFINDDEKFQPI